MSRRAALEPPPPPTWTEALSVLPAALRLQVQRTVAADVAAQEAWPRPGTAAAAAALAIPSRAYASGNSATLTPTTGLGVFRGFAMQRSSCGGHVEAVSRKFPSTSGLLAGLLAEASRTAARPLPTYPAAPQPTPSAGSATAAAAAAAPAIPDPSLVPLAADLAAHGLDAAYRVALLKALKRHLLARKPGGAAGSGAAGSGGEGEAAAWLAQSDRCPATVHLLLTGVLEKEAARAFAETQASAAGVRAVALDLD